jgi:MFS family permease
MSLYFGIGVLGAVFLVFYLWSSARTYAWLVAILFATWVLIGAYSFLLPPAFAMLIFAAISTLTVDRNIKRRTWVAIAIALMLFVGVFYAVMTYWQRFLEVAAFPGSVVTVDANYLWFFTIVGIVFALVTNSQIQFQAIALSVGSLFTVVSVYLVELIPGNEAASYSYYSSKMILGVTSACFLVLPLFLSLLIGRFILDGAPSGSSNYRRARAVMLFGLVGLLPLTIIEAESPVNNPYAIIRNDSNTLDQESVKEVVSRWGDGPTLYFRLVDNPKIAPYPSIGHDRMINLWSPASWGSEGSWGRVWNWVYGELFSNEAAVLCGPLQFQPFSVVTRDPQLEFEVNQACPGTETRYIVLPRLSL